MTTWPQFSAQFASADFASGRATLALNEIWQQAHQGCFASVGQRRSPQAGENTSKDLGQTESPRLQLHYHFWQPATATATLVLIPGRIEAGHKYLEFIHDALVAGFQVFVLDHQGQGASERLDPQSQIGDVQAFNHYVSDLDYFIQHIVKPRSQLPLLALAHSMGGGILCRYLQQHPEHGLAAAIFCSPMWGISTQPVPAALALPLSQGINQLNQFCNTPRWYVPGQGPYQNRPFENNDLTQCPERYHWFRALYQQYPEYQLGGISWRWLAEALLACQQMQQGPAPALPCLLLQAGADQVVDNQAQTRVWQRFVASSDRASPSAMHILPDARHELLFETDAIRTECLERINQFLTQLP